MTVFILITRRADAYERAIALCNNNAERAYLQQRLDEMLKDGS